MNQKKINLLKSVAIVAFLMCCALGSEAQSSAVMNRNGKDVVVPDRVLNFKPVIIGEDGTQHTVGDLKVIPMGVLSPKEQEAALDKDLMTKMKEMYGPGEKAMAEFKKAKALRLKQEENSNRAK